MAFKKVVCGSLLLFRLLSAPALHAQIRSATITGSVQDSTGAVLPNTDVVLINAGTNVSNKTKTTEAGQFAFPYLPPGTYTVEVAVQGFAPYRETEIPLATNQTRRVDVTLRPGTVQSAVDVRAQLEQLQTDSSTIQTATQAAVIQAIPNIVQNPLYYAMLQAGVVPRDTALSTTQTTGMNSFGIGFYGRMNWSAAGINGGRAFTNDIQLDGLAVMGSGYNEAAVVPNTEGLQEVRVISNDFTAEYGRGQGVISMITKSGTNAFHGEANYHLRNDALNANSNYNNANGIAKGPFKLNDFGGAIGGPIIKNKLFFFTSYHYMRFNQADDWLLTVPTALERNGDFSQTKVRDYNGLPVPAQIFNPFSVTQLGPNLYQRAPYPNAIITNPDPHGLAMYAPYPLPNRTPDDVFNTNNFGTRTSKTYRKQSSNSRIDYKFGPHSIYGSGGLGYGDILTGSPWGPKSLYFPSGDRETRDFNPYGQIGDIIALSPTLFVDLRYGITRVNMIEQGGSTSGFTNYDAFGIPKSVQAIMPVYGGTPDVLPGSWSALNNSTNNNKREWQANQTVSGSVTKVKGNWTHKAGAEFRDMVAVWQDYYQLSADISAGNFTSQYAAADGSNVSQNVSAAQQGVTAASLLVGAGAWDVNLGRTLKPIISAKYMALFSQNDWHASSKLTLNLGLRWDLQPGPTERHNRMSGFDLSKENPWGTLGAVVFPGTDGYSRNLWNTQYTNFGPRVGAAYQLTSNLVVRGGFGISYLPTNTGNYSSQLLYNVGPFTSGTNDLPYGLAPHGVPVGRFSDEGVSLIVPAIGADPKAPSVYSPGSGFPRNIANSRAEQWNVLVEKRFGSSWLLSAGYVASRGDHLQTSWLSFENLQNLPSSTLAGWRSQYIASNGTLDPSNEQVPNPYQPATGPLRAYGGALGNQTIPQYIPLLPYPLLSNLWALQDNRGSSIYNSLQLRVNHAFTNGFTLDAHYTWSKAMDSTSTIAEDTQGLNNGGGNTSWDLHNSYNNKKYSFSDIPHRFVLTALYELPFGPGKSFAIPNRILRDIFGNWQTSAVATVQDGFPFGPDGLNDGAALGRTNRIPGVSIQVPKSLQHWYDGNTSVTLPCGRVVTPPKNTFLKYNSCAFQGDVVSTPDGSVVPDVYWYGTAASTYGDMRGPGRFNIDMGLRRVFRIREQLSVALGADATNLLNHTQYWGGPNGTYSNYLGSTNLVADRSVGLVPGMGTNGSFGTMGVASLDPRQFVLNVRITF